MNSYQELKVWQISMDLAEKIYNVTREYPQEEKFGLTSQMRRAAVSIPSNIAEGWGRGSTKEYIQFLNIAKGSLKELETQIILSHRLKMLSSNQDLLVMTEQIGKMLIGLIKSLKNRV